MRKLMIAAMVMLTACVQTETSAIIEEPGKVEQISFSAGGTGSSVGYDLTGKGGLSVGSVTMPDRFEVVLSCKHGRFNLNPEGENAKRLWSTLKVGDSVMIRYQEMYEVGKTPDGKPYKILTDMDFIDAVVKR